MSAAHIAGAVLAVAIGGYVVWRWRRLEFERRAGLILLAIALGVYASGALSALPDPKELIVNIAEALGPWTYALVGGMAFLETGAFVGLVAPGETVVIAGGVIAGQGEIDLVPLIGVVWICAVLGDTASFFIGRRLGRRFLEKHGPRVKITSDRLTQVEGYFERHGGKTILIGRFIGLVGRSRLSLPGHPASGIALHPIQHRRRGALGHALLRTGVHLLALLRQGRCRGRAGGVRLRHHGLGDRRRGGGLSAPRADPAVAAGAPRTPRRYGRCSRSAAQSTAASYGPGSGSSDPRCASCGTGSLRAASGSR